MSLARTLRRRKMRVAVLTDRPEHAGKNNYERQFYAVAAQLRGKPGVHHVDIFHDSWCSIYDGGRCDCNPEVRARKEEGS